MDEKLDARHIAARGKVSWEGGSDAVGGVCGVAFERLHAG